jgi:Xaa-Pro aminopeptidase
MDIQLATVDLPDFGLPTEVPQLAPQLYEFRLERLRWRMADEALDFLIIYADREHLANLSWVSGYDPRFEEALLVVDRHQLPLLLIGNEGYGFADLAPAPLRKLLYQPLSLLGQSRKESSNLKKILTEEGIHTGVRIGVAGWKYFSQEEFDNAAYVFETPSYLIDLLRQLTGDHHKVVNANYLFMNPVDGLRIINEAEQLAAFEFAACYSSDGVKKVLWDLQPGMTEYEAAALMGVNGIPLSCHLMLSAGPRAAYGLPSPSMNRLEEGQPFTMALGLWGALNARAGWLVRDATGLPEGAKDYLQKLAIPYFRAVAAWYEKVGIGVTGGELYDTIHGIIGDPFFGVSLNPGHYLHLDEWVHSPVDKGSKIQLRSGMAIQVDVIPATGSIYHTINIEDGIALADTELRAEIASKFPEMWQRILARRSFMEEVIGIRLKPEVLPFSNIPAYLPPFMLSPTQVLVGKK